MITGTNSFAPSISVGDGSLTVTTQAGTVFLQGVQVIIPITNTVVSTNATTVIYIDLGTRKIATSTSFPPGCYPICTAVTNLSGLFVSLTDNRPDLSFNGLEFLTAGVISTSGTVNFQARDWVEARIRVRFYNPADIISIQFNGDTGNNYCSRAVNMPTGGIVWANPIDLTATDRIRLASSTTTGNRSIDLYFANALNKSKIAITRPGSTSGSSATGILLELSQGEWFNTTAQVTSITVTTAAASAMGADIAVFGKNFT